jgi:hypothetical protein
MLQPTRFTLASVSIFLAGVSFTPAHAQQAPEPTRAVKDDQGVYSFSFENDIFAGNDSNYTNGVRLSYFSPEDVPHWLESSANAIPFFAEEGHKRWGLTLGQNMFTPDNISNRTPDPTDQPYAGWLYGSAGVVSDTGKTLDTFQLTLGMVGPSSYAEQTQDFIHHLVADSPQPQGWDHQLKDEPGIILSYERKWRNMFEFTPFGWGFDITPSAGVNLGNVYTNATVGAVARFGYDLPADYGPPLIRPSLSGSDFFLPNREFGWYLFGGLEGTAVGRNIFLDGNTFRDSPSVDKNPLVGGIQAGVAFTISDTRISYTHVIRTDQFKGQKEREEFGSLNVSLRF